jgi:hypothetical protein
MVAPPSSHSTGSVNQGLGLNNSSFLRIHRLVNRGCDFGGPHPRYVYASRDRAGQGQVLETLEHRDDPYVSEHGHVTLLLAIDRRQVGWCEEGEKEVRIGDFLFHEIDNVPVLESRKNRRNRFNAYTLHSGTLPPIPRKLIWSSYHFLLGDPWCQT